MFFTYPPLLLQINEEAENGRMKKKKRPQFSSLFIINHGQNVVISTRSGQTPTLCL